MTAAADPMLALVDLIAARAWDPHLETTYQPGPDGSTVPMLTTVPSPLLAAVATVLAREIKEDPEFREIFLTGLRKAVLTDEWLATLRRVVPQIALRVAGAYTRAEIPEWAKDALQEHLLEWLGEEASSEIIERMLSQGRVTVTVERAAAEVRR